MKKFLPLTATALVFTLAACGEGKKDQAADEAPTTQEAEQASGETAGMMEKATEMAKEKATEVAEALKLDTSSLDSFKSSLAAMKGSLSGDQASQLTSALTSLAKGASSEEKGGLMGAAKNIASGKSMEETLYETLGNKLNGMTFDDILKLAG